MYGHVYQSDEAWTIVLRAFGAELNSKGLKTMDTVYNVFYTRNCHCSSLVCDLSWENERVSLRGG